MSSLIQENEKILICCYCKYKWHYKTHAEHEQACEDDKFGYSTLISFYPSGLYLSNTYYGGIVPKDKKEVGVIYDKKITYEEFNKMLRDDSTEGDMYDWHMEYE